MEQVCSGQMVFPRKPLEDDGGKQGVQVCVFIRLLVTAAVFELKIYVQLQQVLLSNSKGAPIKLT